MNDKPTRRSWFGQIVTVCFGSWLPMQPEQAKALPTETRPVDDSLPDEKFTITLSLPTPTTTYTYDYETDVLTELLAEESDPALCTPRVSYIYTTSERNRKIKSTNDAAK